MSHVMSEPYSLRGGTLWRRIDGHADATAVIDTHLALLVDIHDGSILSHGARRFVRQDRAHLMTHQPGRLDPLAVATLDETLLVFTKPIAAITEDWLAGLNALLSAGGKDMRRVSHLFPSEAASSAA